MCTDTDTKIKPAYLIPIPNCRYTNPFLNRYTDTDTDIEIRPKYRYRKFGMRCVPLPVESYSYRHIYRFEQLFWVWNVGQPLSEPTFSSAMVCNRVSAFLYSQSSTSYTCFTCHIFSYFISAVVHLKHERT